jgi:hypothetical protein
MGLIESAADGTPEHLIPTPSDDDDCYV